ncbi:hypothetical protein CRG98_023277, partial [Punica granatum]
SCKPTLSSKPHRPSDVLNLEPSKSVLESLLIFRLLLVVSKKGRILLAGKRKDRDDPEPDDSRPNPLIPTNDDCRTTLIRKAGRVKAIDGIFLRVIYAYPRTPPRFGHAVLMIHDEASSSGNS